MTIAVLNNGNAIGRAPVRKDKKGEPKTEKDFRRVWVGGVPRGIKEQQVREIVQRFGSIENIEVGFQGFLFVVYEQADAASKCIEELHGRDEVANPGRTNSLELASGQGYATALKKRGEQQVLQRQERRGSQQPSGRGALRSLASLPPPPAPPPVPPGHDVPVGGRPPSKQRGRPRGSLSRSRSGGSYRRQSHSPRGSPRRDGGSASRTAAAAATGGKEGGGARSQSPWSRSRRSGGRSRSRSGRRSRSRSRSHSRSRSRRRRSWSRSRSQSQSRSDCNRRRARSSSRFSCKAADWSPVKVIRSQSKSPTKIQPSSRTGSPAKSKPRSRSKSPVKEIKPTRSPTRSPLLTPVKIIKRSRSRTETRSRRQSPSRSSGGSSACTRAVAAAARCSPKRATVSQRQDPPAPPPPPPRQPSSPPRQQPRRSPDADGSGRRTTPSSSPQRYSSIRAAAAFLAVAASRPAKEKRVLNEDRSGSRRRGTSPPAPLPAPPSPPVAVATVAVAPQARPKASGICLRNAQRASAECDTHVIDTSTAAPPAGELDTSTMNVAGDASSKNGHREAESQSVLLQGPAMVDIGPGDATTTCCSKVVLTAATPIGGSSSVGSRRRRPSEDGVYDDPSPHYDENTAEDLGTAAAAVANHRGSVREAALARSGLEPRVGEGYEKARRNVDVLPSEEAFIGGSMASSSKAAGNAEAAGQPPRFAAQSVSFVEPGRRTMCIDPQQPQQHQQLQPQQPQQGQQQALPDNPGAIVAYETHTHNFGFTPSLTYAPPSTALIVDVALCFQGRRKLVRHLDSTRAGELAELHPRLIQAAGGRPLVVVDADGFEIGKELPIGFLARQAAAAVEAASGGAGGAGDGEKAALPLELHLQPDEWAD